MSSKRPVLPEISGQDRVLPIDRPACSCTAMRRAARAITRLYDEALSPTGLRLSQFSLLANLDRYGAVPMSGLTEVLDLDRTTLTRNLAPLERDGLLSVRSAGHGRAKIVSLTSQGRARLRAAYPHWLAAQDRFGAIVGPRKTRDLLSLAETLADRSQP